MVGDLVGQKLLWTWVSKGDTHKKWNGLWSPQEQECESPQKTGKWSGCAGCGSTPVSSRSPAACSFCLPLGEETGTWVNGYDSWRCPPGCGLDGGASLSSFWSLGARHAPALLALCQSGGKASVCQVVPDRPSHLGKCPAQPLTSGDSLPTLSSGTQFTSSFCHLNF